MNGLMASPNIFGIETEYSYTLALPGNIVREFVGQCHSEDFQLGLNIAPTEKGIDGVTEEQFIQALAEQELWINDSGMMSNGARYYVDPSGPEYDTQETTTAEEAVYRTFDGDEILLRVFHYLVEHEIIENFQLNRRIVDHNRTSRGIHLNTMTSLGSSPNIDQTQALGALNVVKGAIFGSGGLLVNSNGETEFHHSPRLSLTSHVSASYSEYTKRPLVRIPFKDDGPWRRVETVTSDALNFAWPLRASLVATNALIGLIELGHLGALPQLRDPVTAARMVGRLGPDARISVIERTGEVTTKKPLDVLRYICEVVKKVDDHEDYLDPEGKQVIGEIIDVADKESNDMRSVANRVESVGRLVAMERKMEKSKVKLELSSRKMCQFDYYWDRLGGGLAERLRNGKASAGWQGFHNRIESPRKLAQRRITPPQDTRAGTRGQAIRDYRGDYSASWNYDYKNDPDNGVYVPPFATEKPEKLIPGLSSWSQRDHLR